MSEDQAQEKPRTSEYVIRFEVPARITDNFMPPFAKLAESAGPLAEAVVTNGGNFGVTVNGEDVTANITLERTRTATWC